MLYATAMTLADEREGLQELVGALARAGIPASSGIDDALVIDGVSVHVHLERMAVVTSVTARGLAQPVGDVLAIVIADRISEEARRELIERGWGWFDRRGHIRLWAEGVRVSTEVDFSSAKTAKARFAAVFPPVGIEVALALLMARGGFAETPG